VKKYIIVFLAAVLCVTCIIPTMADNKNNANDKMNEIDNKLNQIEQEKNEVYKQRNELEKERQAVVSSHEEENEEYEKLMEELDLLNSEIQDYEDSLEQAEEKYGKQSDEFQKRLVIMYKNSYITYIDILADSKNFVDFFQRLEIMSSVAKKDKDIIKEFQAIKKDTLYKKQLVENLKSTKKNELSEKRDIINELVATRNGLEDKLKESENKLKNLDQQEDSLIQQSIQIANQIRKAGGSKKYAGGTMVWPVPSCRKIDSYFGNRLHPILKKYKMHTGVDIDAAHGASIVAANKGVVICAEWQDGYGYTVIVNHGGGITTLYAHCSSLLVNYGDTVNKGQVIAKAGNTGMATGTHLHFEVRVDGNVVNPLDYIK
jgi:murein DD-endopeptidase MepM/ murein hydrolase activator NlpD